MNNRLRFVHQSLALSTLLNAPQQLGNTYLQSSIPKEIGIVQKLETSLTSSILSVVTSFNTTNRVVENRQAA